MAEKENRDVLMEKILTEVQKGTLPVDEALELIQGEIHREISREPFADIDFARVDLHRKERQGASEVIYGAGKTPEQIRGIAETMYRSGQERIMITRLSPAAAGELSRTMPMPMEYFEKARIGLTGGFPEKDGNGTILVLTGGTSDIPVAEEAAVTAEILGNEVTRVYDVGVAGIHRLFAHLDEILEANIIIAAAGMEGALASVVGGLASCPVIALPTGVGYGTAFGGVTALLSMLNSCAGGVSVVNIDNGFGAGFLASRINHMKTARGKLTGGASSSDETARGKLTGGAPSSDETERGNL